jgi:hypothetical protein
MRIAEMQIVVRTVTFAFFVFFAVFWPFRPSSSAAIKGFGL